MKAIEKARSLLEVAEYIIEPWKAEATRDLARAWLELARTQHACGIPEAAPAPAEVTKPTYGKGGRQ